MESSIEHHGLFLKSIMNEATGTRSSFVRIWCSSNYWTKMCYGLADIICELLQIGTSINICLFIICIWQCLFSGQMTVMLMMQDAMLVDSFCLLITLVAQSHVECAVLCSLNIECGFFYYDVATLICDLLYVDTSNCLATSYAGKPVFNLTRDNNCI